MSDDTNTFSAAVGSVVSFGSYQVMVFDPSKEKFPHSVGWCGENGIEHNWRHPYRHSFNGPHQYEYERYCINCGQQQHRTPPVTTPASDWIND